MAQEPKGAEELPGVDATNIYPATPAGFRDALHEQRWDMRGCFEDWLAENPDLEGTFELALTFADSW